MKNYSFSLKSSFLGFKALQKNRLEMKSLIIKPKPKLARTRQLSHSAPPPLFFFIWRAVDSQAASIVLRMNTYGFSSPLQKKSNTKAGLSTPISEEHWTTYLLQFQAKQPRSSSMIAFLADPFKWLLLWLPCQQCQQSVTLTTSLLNVERGEKLLETCSVNIPGQQLNQCW